MGLFSDILTVAAGPIVGGLFGWSQQRSAQRAASAGTDFVKLRKNAEAAGFNPLTALMATGGQGFQRSFQPDLSTGAFISDAISRGADTYFNSVQADAEASALRQRDLARRVEATKTGVPVASFGYDLTQQRYVPSPVSVSAGAVSDPVAGQVKPRPNPAYADLEYIPVRMPNGSNGKLEKSIARRLDIKPYDVVSAGDFEEIVGETPLTEVENMVFLNGIRKTATGAGPVQKALDQVGGFFAPRSPKLHSDPVAARKRSYQR